VTNTAESAAKARSLVRLGDVASRVSYRHTPDPEITERWVGADQLDDGDLRVRRWSDTNDPMFPPTFKFRFDVGAVLIHSRNPKKVAIADFQAITGEKLFALGPTDPAALDPRFLALQLQSSSFERFVARWLAGSVNKFLNWTALERYEFALPPLEEQNRIIEVLEAAQDTVHQALQVEAAASAAERSLLAAVLTWDATSLATLSDAPYIMTPLAEIAVLRRGRFSHRPRNEPRLYAREGPHPFVQTGDVQRADWVIRTFSQYLSPEGVKYSRCVPPGTLLVTIAAVIGASARTSVETYLPDSIVSVDPIPGVSDSRFLEVLVRGLRPHLDNVVASENTQKNLSLEKLGSVLVPVTELPLQERIASEWEALRSFSDRAAASTAAASGLLRALREELMGAPR
jgi:type I restriction enzyme S subunit